jgi:hypothetical protein
MPNQHQAVSVIAADLSRQTIYRVEQDRAAAEAILATVGTYGAIDQKHVPRYLAEFEYRFNRRYDLAAMMPRLT